MENCHKQFACIVSNLFLLVPVTVTSTVKCYDIQCWLQREDTNQSDSDEEPSPEALARYLAMRRHTVGVGDSRHEVPEDVRVKLAQHQPIIAMPQPNFFMPYGFNPLVANTNLPMGMKPPWPAPPQNNPPFGDQYHLQLPPMIGPGRNTNILKFYDFLVFRFKWKYRSLTVTQSKSLYDTHSCI